MAVVLSTRHDQRRRSLVSFSWEQDQGSKKKGKGGGGDVDDTSRKIQRRETHGVAEWGVERQGQPG
jgi:hypothetical protein